MVIPSTAALGFHTDPSSSAAAPSWVAVTSSLVTVAFVVLALVAGTASVALATHIDRTVVEVAFSFLYFLNNL